MRQGRAGERVLALERQRSLEERVSGGTMVKRMAVGTVGEVGARELEIQEKSFATKSVKENILTEKRTEIGHNMDWSVQVYGVFWREAGGCGGKLPRNGSDPEDSGAWGGERA